MVKGIFKLMVGVFGAVLAVLLSLQIAPGTMNTVITIGVVGIFVTLVILIMAFAMVAVSRSQAEAIARVSERAMDSQVRIALISRASHKALDRFLDAGGLVLEKEGEYYLSAPGYRKPVAVEKAGLNDAEVNYLIEHQET
ncbi:MAG TPA: hypothetical protein VH186_09465 [Chloroflexia bacterium]|nr:hypothetical protein [Chloroflexia bacterium]